ncbi:aminotransferase class V-fold PLP-dependent enzyme [uncultured Paracoccus sp.]|uniref:pyridoxal-phosphate-dependent aminotransferase family protein n=1 Tax=uncultured Paracoccus sp. TaxID=189685 RepID=UPI002615B617|nr:aminotransferase class V-fold PLP-dependent enzyme [uncultured Paracoccus sp.]
MSFAAGRPVLAIPGPSPVPDRVLRAMHRSSPDIYGGELVDLNLRVMADLKRLAGTRHHLAPYIGNGHAAWEAANANLFSPGDRALVLASGHFGRGWAQAARAVGVEVEVLDFGNAAPPDPQRLTERLAQDRAGKIRAVMVCHVDTASGVRADLPALRAAMGDHPAVFAVDAIASLGCERLLMDEWGIDVLLSASQKGVMVPPGLAFVWFSDRVAAPRAGVGPYWDWAVRAQAAELWRFWGGTPPVQHIYGLAEALAMLLDEEGLEVAWARHEGLARAVWAALDAWGADGSGIGANVAAVAARARSVTAVALPGAERLRGWTVDKAGVTLGLGLGADRPGDALRIAHMGHANAHMLLGVLGVMQAGMTALSIRHGAGGLDAAAAEIGRLA